MGGDGLGSETEKTDISGTWHSARLRRRRRETNGIGKPDTRRACLLCPQPPAAAGCARRRGQGLAAAGRLTEGTAADTGESQAWPILPRRPSMFVGSHRASAENTRPHPRPRVEGHPISDTFTLPTARRRSCPSRPSAPIDAWPDAILSANASHLAGVQTPRGPAATAPPTSARPAGASPPACEHPTLLCLGSPPGARTAPSSD